MKIEEVEQAMKALEASGAPPALKQAGQRAVVDMLRAGTASRKQSADEDLADRRHARYLKYALGWLIVGGSAALFITAFGHAMGWWRIARPDQLPWIWGSALTLAGGGAWYLLKSFFPKVEK